MYATVDRDHKLVVFWSERAGSMTVLHYMSQLMGIPSVNIRMTSMRGDNQSFRKVTRLGGGRVDVSDKIRLLDVNYSDGWSSIVIYRDPVKRAVSSYLICHAKYFHGSTVKMYKSYYSCSSGV